MPFQPAVRAAAAAPAPSYRGQLHPNGPGVHALPSPSGTVLVAITDASGVVCGQVEADPGVLDGRAVALMRAWWSERYGRPELRLV